MKKKILPTLLLGLLFSNELHAYKLKKEHTFTKNQKLSNWLNEALNTQKNLYDIDTTLWLTSVEKDKQLIEKTQLINEISNQIKNSTERNFIHWIKNLPITGRVKLPIQDFRIMEIHPKLDPIVKIGDKVEVFEKAGIINVIDNENKQCQVEYDFESTALDYIRACGHIADHVYVIKPNGNIVEQNIANWNGTDDVNIPSDSIIYHAVKGSYLYKNKDINDKVAEIIASQGLNLQVSFSRIKQIKNKNYSYKTNSNKISSSDWGTIGLLQTPTARMENAGTVRANYNLMYPYTIYGIGLQPFDNFEVNMRYVDIDDKKYGPDFFSGNQTYKDKSIDVKLLLLNESEYLPALALGFRDPIGTGFFSGEYLVANKRYKDFDFSLGLGFGYLGNRADIDNPIGLIHNKFKDRVKYNESRVGKTNGQTWFTGKGAIFGGVEWDTPYKPLSVKLEYDGNDYKDEPAGQKDFEASMPFNLGLIWQNENLELSLGYERGNQITGGVSFKDNFATNIPVNNNYKIYGYDQTRSENKVSKKKLIKDFYKIAELNIVGLTRNKDSLHVAIDNYTGSYLKKKLNNGIKVINRYAGTDIKNFYIELYDQQLKMQTIKIDRKQWLKKQSQLLPISQDIQYLYVDKKKLKENVEVELFDKEFGYSIAPSFWYSFGGPDGFIYKLSLGASFYQPLWQNAWINGGVNLRLIDNFDRFNDKFFSNLQRVRTSTPTYMTSSRIQLGTAQINQLAKLDSDLYFLGYLGYLESFFAGVGGEILYRPNQSNWGVGFDLNYVQQREFKQWLDLQDYGVTTGHLNFYWDTNFHDIQVETKIGRYLAGDSGITLDLSRKFKNGLKMGAWATKTTASEEEFGEGRFDKGVYFTMPFEAIISNYLKSNITYVWQPIQRDGGATLNKTYKLWNITHSHDEKLLDYKTP